MAQPHFVDPRAPRFGAWVTSAVLAAALVTGSVVPLAVQAAVFVIGAAAGLRRAPYGVLFRAVLRPRLGPPAELESEAPPRFAQAVGAVFASVALLGHVAGYEALATVATSLALAAAFLNAAFGICLGCEAYLLIRRTTTREGAPA